MRWWFTADSHIGHSLICSIRGFDYQEHHDVTIIESWRKVVKPEDVVIVIGDTFWGQWCPYYKKLWNLLPGNKIVLKGNHDRWLNKAGIQRLDLYHKFIKYDTVKQHIVACHYPMLTWPHRRAGAIHLHGHSHGSRLPEGGRLDVGVDVAKVLLGEWRPFSLEEVMYLLQKKLKITKLIHK